MRNIEIIDGGILTTIQDLGRFGYQRYGVSPCGVMDDYSAKIANILVGNEMNFPVIETTLKGITAKFNGSCVISITGGKNTVLLNNLEIPMWESVYIKKGDTLKIDFCEEGARNYIGVQGGFDIPKVLGSYSTDIKSRLGGFEGRAIKRGDIIPLKKVTNNYIHKTLYGDEILTFSNYETVRVILGPQDDCFTEKGMETFLNTEYEVSVKADRMGTCLKGEKIGHLNSADIISDGISFGAIQIPGSGQPIIMMADRQTTGGYTKIGNVITADLYKLAQLLPGVKIKFQLCTEKEAVDALKNYEEKFIKIRNRYNFKDLRDYKKLKIKIESKEFIAYIKEV